MTTQYTPDEIVKLAVNDIVIGINSGMTPQNALTKTAKELQLNHNFIKRASEAVNVALHHAHFKKHPDAKADDFQITDAQAVADDIYGQKEKTASEFQSETFSEFQFDEKVPKFARYLEAGPHKEAYEKICNTTGITKNATSLNGIMDRSSNYINKLKKIAFEKEAEAMDAKASVNTAFCKILTKFAKYEFDRSSWDQFETAVFSKYGSASEGYLDLLYSSSKLVEPRGAHDANIKIGCACPELALYDDFVANVKKEASAKQEAEDATYNFNVENGSHKAAYAKRGCELNKEATYEADGTLLEKVEASMKRERIKAAGINDEDPVIAYIAQKKASALEDFDGRIKSAIDLIDMASDAAGGAYKGIAKPSLSANTNTPDNNRQRALMLQELVATDPVISKFPTHQTVDAYQQLLRIAPELSSEKEVTRAFLRQAGASQAIDSFQAEQLIDANTSLFKQHQLQQGAQPTPQPKG